MNDEYVDGFYGGFAIRKEDRRFWYTMDSDYTWTSVVDDFGNLTAVSTFVSSRGY
jgi:hypothetical protein